MWIKSKLTELAEEAIETAKELRDIHREDINTRSDSSGQQTSIPTRPVVSSSSSSTTTMVKTAPSATIGANTDVAARLAALRAKLQTNAPPNAASQSAESTTASKTALQQSHAEHIAANRQPSVPFPAASLRPSPYEGKQESASSASDTTNSAQPSQFAPDNSNRNDSATATVAAQLEQYEATVKALTDQLHKEKSMASQLQKEVDTLKEKLEGSLAQANQDSMQLEERLHSAEAECAALREKLNEAQVQQQELLQQAAQPSTTESGPLEKNSTAFQAEIEALTSQIASLTNELSTVNTDRSSLKQQLSRLKTQMLAEQEDEEEKIKWRVDAEVKLALEKVTREASSSSTTDTAALAELQAELDIQRDRADQLEQETIRWEAEASAREAELANLQRALSELSYESEAAERLRSEVRAGQAEIQNLRGQVTASNNAVTAAAQEHAALQAQIKTYQQDILKLKEKEGERDKEVLRLHVALQEAQRKVEEMSGPQGPLSRQAVLEVLIALMKSKRSKEAIEKSISLLELSEEERQRLPSIQESISGGASLADAWLHFLDQQVQHATLDQNGRGLPSQSQGTPPQSPARAVQQPIFATSGVESVHSPLPLPLTPATAPVPIEQVQRQQPNRPPAPVL